MDEPILPADLDRIEAYGLAQPTFGGLHIDVDAVVGFFTGEVVEHEVALRKLLPNPDQVRVQRVRRTHKELRAEQANVWDRLTSLGVKELVGVSIGIHEGEPQVVVRLDPFADAVVSSVLAVVGNTS